MHKYSSKVANVDSMGCLRRQGNTDYPKYACGAVPYWKGKYKSYILHVYWFKHILQLHGTWNWFLMFNIMCFPRNSLDSAMLWASHTYTVVTSAGRATWMKQIGHKCGRHRSKFVIGVINVFSARAAIGMVMMMVLSWSWLSWWSWWSRWSWWS